MNGVKKFVVEECPGSVGAVTSEDLTAMYTVPRGTFLKYPGAVFGPFRNGRALKQFIGRCRPLQQKSARCL